MSSLEERSVIGCLLMDNGQIHKIYDILKPKCSAIRLCEIYTGRL